MKNLLKSACLVLTFTFLSCSSTSLVDTALGGSNQDLSTYHENLFYLGVLAAAASDVADEDDLRNFGLFSIRNPKWDTEFPIRKLVRNKVKSWPTDLKKQVLNQFKKYPSYWSIYSAFFVETIGSAPSFNPKDQGLSTQGNPTFRHVYNSRRSWQALLSKIYKEVGMGTLWNKYKNLWHKN